MRLPGLVSKSGSKGKAMQEYFN